MSIFDRALPAMYRVLGQDATHTTALGAVAPDTKRVLFDKGGSTALDGMQQTLEPTVRVQASQFPAGLPRNDTLTIAGAVWKVRESALPVADGAELQAPLARV